MKNRVCIHGRFMRFMGMGRNSMEFLEVKIPEARPVNMAKLSEDELNAELEKGYADMTAGRTKPAKKVFADIRKDYNI